MKRVLFSFIIILLVLQFVSAVQVDLVKPSYERYEILTAKFSGNFIDNIKEENVFFYRTHVRTPMQFTLQKINGDFYITAMIEDKPSGNYSISIENVRYAKGIEVSDDPIAKTFEILDSQAEFTLDKSVVTTNKSFSIILQNLNEESLTIYLNKDTTEATTTTTQEREISITEALFGMDENETINETTTTEETITYDKEIVLKSGEIKTIQIEPLAVSDPTWTKLKLSSNRTEYEIQIYVFAGDENEIISDEKPIILDNSNKSEDIVKNVSNLTEAESITKTCSQLQGNFCNETQICVDDKTKLAKDGKCCLNECAIKQESASNLKVYGWAILFIIVFFLVWFFKTKYSKTGTRSVSLLGFLRKK